MPFDYIIDAATDLTVIHAIEECDIPSFVRIMETVASDAQFNRETKILFDTSLVNTTLSTDEALLLVEVIASIEVFKSHKIAVLATEQALYGINRVIATLSNLRGANIKVFINLGKAIEWLDREE